MYRIVVATSPARHSEFAGVFAASGSRCAFGEDSAAVADCILAGPTDLLIVDAAALGARAAAIAEEVKRIRTIENLSILVVVSHADAADCLAGMQWDDFVLEPVRAGELVLRVESLLARKRRSGWHQLNFGEVVIDFDKYEVTRGGARVDLTYKEHELLRFLASNPGKPFTRETLLDRVWGSDYIGGVRTVDVHVRRLRAKLGDLQGKIIETVRGLGYRFRKN